MDNKGIITEWDSKDFDPDSIGIILITEDGHFIYGKEDKNVKDNKYIIRHSDIFDACLRKLGISLLCYDQMDYAYSLASDQRNIVSLQIVPIDSMSQVLIVMNLNSTNQQLEVLDTILKYFADYKYGFTADICYGNARKPIYDENSDSKIDLSIGFDEFMERLTLALADLKEEKRSGKR